MKNPTAREYRKAMAFSRRSVLQAGLLSALPLSLPRLLQAGEKKRPKAKSVILLFMWGGPSHLDTWDPKPDAPAEVRGEFKPIATNVPGTIISEHFPRLAKLANRYAVIRSMAHTDPAHLSPTHHLLTGHLARRVNSDADAPSRMDTPHFGSTISKLYPGDGTIPPFITLPWLVSHPAAPGGMAPGQNAGRLGAGFDPFVAVGDPNAPNFRLSSLSRNADQSAEAFQQRAQLLHSLDRSAFNSAGYEAVQTKAMRILTSAKAEHAFHLDEEPAGTRDRYGRNPHGQACLLARRLVEAEVKIVQVNWPDDGRNFWDTHGNNFPRLKNDLMPPTDLAFSALLEDLAQRGLLDETLVVWVGEFGRTPKVVNNGGREHWPRCYSAVLAGGGIQGGQLYGRSDSIAAMPSYNPVGPADLTATIYSALGIDPHQEMSDRLGRPLPLTPGNPVTDLF